jgi:hypothetical protein
MPYLIHAYRRLTHKYKQRFRDEDKFDYDDVVVLKRLGGRYLWPYYADRYDDMKLPRHRAKFLKRNERSYDPSDDGKSYFTVVNLTKGASDERVEQAIREEFSTGGCGHDYDCCGCGSSYPYTIRKTKANEWFVIQSHSRNY